MFLADKKYLVAIFHRSSQELSVPLMIYLGTVLMIQCNGSKHHVVCRNLKIVILSTLVLLLALLTIVRFGNAQPTIQTLSATDITATSATLTGNLNTNGQDTDWSFKVFDASGAEIQTVCPDAWNAASTGLSEVTCPVTGLQPATTYGFALIAIWHGGSGDYQYGSIVSFTTLGEMVSIFTNIFTAISTTGGGALTDWALSNLRMTPSHPQVGDHLTFQVGLTALSTNAPYPQNVGADCWVDSFPPFPPVGASPTGGAITYLGPTGAPMTLTVNYPWTATAGTHTITCSAIAASDPDVSNNQLTVTFMVGTSQPSVAVPFDFTMALTPISQSVNPGGAANYMVGLSYSDSSYAGTTVNIQLTGLGPGMDYQLSQSGSLTITTSPMTPTGVYTFTITGSALGVNHQTAGTINVTPQSSSVSTASAPMSTTSTFNTRSLESTLTSVVTETATVQPTSNSTPSSTVDFPSLLRQNSLLIIAVLAIALIAIWFKGRARSTSSPPQTQPTPINATYCSHCGTQNPATNRFCRKCGAKLVDTTNSQSQA